MKRPRLQTGRGAVAETPEQDFRPGQRWFSETQGELGLGVVLEVDARLVRLLFPATGEERVYARHNAPLWRARFDIGDPIRDTDGNAMEIAGVDEQDGVVSYRVRDAHGAEQRLAETRLDPHLHLNRPQQKLRAGRLDKDIWFRLRRRTWQQAGDWSVSPVRGLVGPRISPIPHQLYIAGEVAGRWAPRVLLADEVGLGKTIEAGLILHRLLLEGEVQRALVVAPEPLLHQWLVELLRRFNLRFALFDRERMAQLAGAAERNSANPFETEQRVLCSLELLTETPAHAAAVLGAQWDLLIVDEAHHLHWSPEDSGLDYDLIEALAEQIPAVLLLTATPEQFGRAGHFGRLRLLDPQRFGAYQGFLDEEADYAPVAELAARVQDGTPLTPEQRVQLEDLLGDTAGLAPADILERLLDRHGTGRVLFRNTRAAIAGFPERRAHPEPLPAPAGWAHTGIEALQPEQTAGPDWPEQDPRVSWLVETLRALHPEKVLLIAARAQTVLELRRHLAERVGIQAAVFHEGMEIVERDRAAAYFADPHEGARLLLCSEIGSEGRNFQFAHHLVLFDLPLEPELLEQRIGRLDRIGQTRTVELHLPYLTGTAMETLYRWYAEGLDAFAAHCPAASAVFERLREPLLAALAEPPRADAPAADAPVADAPVADALLAEAATLRERLNAELASGRDRLLELGSHRPTVSSKLVGAVELQDRDPALYEYLCGFWDAFGVDYEPGPGGATVIRPGRHMLQERFPGLPEDGLTVTFDRAHALAHEDRAFLTWEHPMVRQAMELLTNSDLGSAAMLLTRDPRFGTGALLLELLFVAECAAPPELGVGRFLPRLGRRLLLDEQGRDHAGAIGPDALDGKCMTGNRKLANAVLQAKADAIDAMLAAGEAAAERARDALQQEALGRMEQVLGAEEERLGALSQVNPNIREDELEALILQRERLRELLARVHLRLDAVRLIVHA